MTINDESIVRHLPLVRSIAYRLRRRLRNVEVEDLVSAGTVGLVEAAARFAPSYGVPFGNFAYERIRGAMLDEVRRQAPTPLSLESVLDERQELKLIEVTENPRSPSAAKQTELQELVAAVGALPQREREVLTLRVQGYSLDEIGRAYGCSESRASQLLSRARFRLEGWLAA